MSDTDYQLYTSTFETAYKGKVPISRRNRNFMGWIMGLEPTIFRATI